MIQLPNDYARVLELIPDPNGKNVQSALDELNQLPLPNKRLINRYFRLLHLIYKNKVYNHYGSEDLAKQIYPRLTKEDTKNNGDNPYPMLARFIKDRK